MSKDPAFLFYPNDWAGGTQWMTRLERGAYLDLLLYQVSNTCFSLDDAKRVLGADFDACWPRIKEKFLEKNGKFFNAKLTEVIEKRRNFTESRRNNRLSSDKHLLNTSKTLVKQVGNGNGNGNGNEDEKKGMFRKPAVAEITAYCAERKNKVDPQGFWDFYESKGWKIGSQPMKDWKAAVRTWERNQRDDPKKADLRPEKNVGARIDYSATEEYLKNRQKKNQ